QGRACHVDVDVPQDRLVLERYFGLQPQQTRRTIELAEHESTSNTIWVHPQAGLVNRTFLHQRERLEVLARIAQDVTAATDIDRAVGASLDAHKLGDVHYQVGPPDAAASHSATCSSPVPLKGP